MLPDRLPRRVAEAAMPGGQCHERMHAGIVAGSIEAKTQVDVAASVANKMSCEKFKIHAVQAVRARDMHDRRHAPTTLNCEPLCAHIGLPKVLPQSDARLLVGTNNSPTQGTAVM